LAETGYKQALADVVAAARAEELQRRTEEDQLDLFGAVGAVAPVVRNGQNGHVPAVTNQPRMGRPVGSRNRRTDEAARLYMQRFGDPLARAIEIAAMPILADGVSAFAKQIGAPSHFEAFKAWASINASAMPFSHQRLATLTVRPAGSPDGEPIELAWSYAEDEVLDHLELTHDNPRRDEEER
jgi:hypothetical protein